MEDRCGWGWIVLLSCMLALALACGDDSDSDAGDGDGSDVVGDGDGDSTGDGDGDTAGDGDGDTATGDGDGDTTGDGDGDTTGDGDGDTGDGDGDAMDEDAGTGDGDGDSGCSIDSDCDDSDDTTFDDCTDAGECVNRAVTYDDDMGAIFSDKCSSCHTRQAGCSGGVCFGRTFADTQDDADNGDCTGLKIWQCIPVRIASGDMPNNRGCEGDPVMDMGDSDCLTAEEHALLDAWVAGGGLENSD